MRKHLRLAATVAVLGSFAAGEAAAVCVNESQRAALNMRMLQTELMVAALTCDRKDSYNAFVRKHEVELVSSGKQLRKFFAATYGGQGQRNLDGFITRLANEASQRSLVDRASYCPTAEKLYSNVLTTALQHVWRVASEQPFSDGYGIPTCATRVAEKDKVTVTTR